MKSVKDLIGKGSPGIVARQSNIGEIPVVCATEHISKRCREAVGKRIEKVVHLKSVSDAELIEFDRMLSRCRYCPHTPRKDDPERIHRALREILPKLLSEAANDEQAKKFLNRRLETINESFFVLNQQAHTEGLEEEIALSGAKSDWIFFLSQGVRSQEGTPTNSESEKAHYA